MCVSSDGPMMTWVRTGLPIDLKVDVVLLPLEADGIGGKGPDLLAVDGDADGDVPARVNVAVGVGSVDLGLECAGGRVEREARTDDLALAASTANAWMRISTVSFSWMKYDASSGTPTNTRTGSICSARTGGGCSNRRRAGGVVAGADVCAG